VLSTALARGPLPRAEHVARGIAEGRNPKVAFTTRGLHDLAAVGRDSGERVVDAVDVDVQQYTCFTGD
jgi:hypothetical protein